MLEVIQKHIRFLEKRRAQLDARLIVVSQTLNYLYKEKAFRWKKE